MALRRGWRRLATYLQPARWISARHELDRLRRQMQEEIAARNRMLALVSHELRTPLHGIIGLTELLRNTELSPEQLNYVQSLDASGRLLLSMVNELLERARANALGATEADAPPALKPFDPVRLVEDIVEILAPRAHARGLEMACFIAPQLRGAWLGDELRLRQVLLNLVGNAVKFTRAGGVSVSLEPEEHGLRLTVADTGPGIPPEVEKRLFTPFARAAAHDVAREGGAGLGLSIVNQLLASMGGSLHLENVPGAGAVFHLHLPLRPAMAHEPANAGGDDGGVPHRAALAVKGAGLRGTRFHLVMPSGPVRRGLERYIASYGGQACASTPEKLPELVHDTAAEIVVDARHADELRAALQGLEAGAPMARIWLLLTPEQRLHLHELMRDERIHGYLLRPLRRDTIEERLVRGQVPERLTRSVAALRQIRQGAHMAEKRRTGQAPLVLIAEDNPVNAQIARAVLERNGYRTWRVDDGRLALEWMKQALQGRLERPACILMDVHMPGMGGLKATEALRRLEHELRAQPTPVLALSAGTADDERARCLAAGMNGFLPKPFEPEELVDAVRRAQRTTATCQQPGQIVT